jgi:hypothetical protein
MKNQKHEESLNKTKPKKEQELPSCIMSKEEQLEELASIIVDIYLETYYEKNNKQTSGKAA